MEPYDKIFENEDSSLTDKMFNHIWKIYRNKIDKYIFYIKTRWFFTLLMLSYYIYRLIIYGGFYVISYVMGLYILHLSVQFFQPIGFPSIEEDNFDETIYEDLPIAVSKNTQNDEEFKPLIRSVSEFKFWQRVTIAIIISIACTFSQYFDLPVFWPFLLIYFLILTMITFKKMINHMNRFGYGFFDGSKKNFSNAET